MRLTTPTSRRRRQGVIRRGNGPTTESRTQRGAEQSEKPHCDCKALATRMSPGMITCSPQDAQWQIRAPMAVALRGKSLREKHRKRCRVASRAAEDLPSRTPKLQGMPTCGCVQVLLQLRPFEPHPGLHSGPVTKRSMKAPASERHGRRQSGTNWQTCSPHIVKQDYGRTPAAKPVNAETAARPTGCPPTNCIQTHSLARKRACECKAHALFISACSNAKGCESGRLTQACTMH